MPTRSLFTIAMGGGANPAYAMLAPPPEHFAANFSGLGWLTTPNSGQFDFNGAPSSTLRVMAWVKLDAKSFVAVQHVAGVAQGISAATDSWGIQYNGFVDRWQTYKSNGLGFTGLLGGISPTVGVWYGIAATLGYNFLSMDTYTLAGLQESVSVGLGDNSYNPILTPFSVGARTSGNGLLTGSVDSLSVTYSPVPIGSNAPGGVLYHGGLAPDWAELSPFDLLALETIRLWADFNEPSGSVSYIDSSGAGATLARSGIGITRVNGAGY